MRVRISWTCLDSPEKSFFSPKNWENGPKLGLKQRFLSLLKSLVISFRICSIMKIYIPMFLHKSHIWENFSSWDMGQNVLNQISGFLINHVFTKISEIAWFFACWYKFTEIKSWLKNFGVGMVRNGCGQSGHGTLKLTVSQEGIDGMNWFFAYWCKVRKAKSEFNDFWVNRVQLYVWPFSSWDLKICFILRMSLWIEWFSASSLWCSNFRLDQHRTLYFWLLKASLLQVVFVVPPGGSQKDPIK